MFLQVKRNIDKSIKDNPEDVKLLVQFFKENQDISETFFAIDNLQNGLCKGNIDDFINFNINKIKDGKTIFETVSNKEGEITKLDEAILFLVENEKTAINYSKYENNFNFLKENIKYNNLSVEADAKISNILESLDNTEHKQLIEQLAIAENKEVFFNNLKNEVILTINEALLSDDKELRYALLESKEDVSNLSYDEKTFVDKVVKLQEYKNVVAG